MKDVVEALTNIEIVDSTSEGGQVKTEESHNKTLPYIIPNMFPGVGVKGEQHRYSEDTSVSDASLVETLPLEHIPETNLCMAQMHVTMMSVFVAFDATA